MLVRLRLDDPEILEDAVNVGGGSLAEGVGALDSGPEAFLETTDVAKACRGPVEKAAGPGEVAMEIVEVRDPPQEGGGGGLLRGVTLGDGEMAEGLGHGASLLCSIGGFKGEAECTGTDAGPVKMQGEMIDGVGAAGQQVTGDPGVEPSPAGRTEGSVDRLANEGMSQDNAVRRPDYQPITLEEFQSLDAPPPGETGKAAEGSWLQRILVDR